MEISQQFKSSIITIRRSWVRISVGAWMPVCSCSVEQSWYRKGPVQSLREPQGCHTSKKKGICTHFLCRIPNLFPFNLKFFILRQCPRFNNLLHFYFLAAHVVFQRKYCNRPKNSTPQNYFFRTLPCSTIPKKIFFGGKIFYSCLSVCPYVTTDISGTSGPICLKFWLEIKFVNTPRPFFNFLEKLILKGCQHDTKNIGNANRVSK